MLRLLFAAWAALPRLAALLPFARPFLAPPPKETPMDIKTVRDSLLRLEGFVRAFVAMTPTKADDIGADILFEILRSPNLDRALAVLSPPKALPGTPAVEEVV